ncbi:MAG: hypothetical protein [Microvirus sp.]|nr:MAG: hypothetical protein [Microvirus sp.]
MKRRRESSRRRRRTFGHTAMRTHKKNIPGNSMRGGIRL